MSFYIRTDWLQISLGFEFNGMGWFRIYFGPWAFTWLFQKVDKDGNNI